MIARLFKSNVNTFIRFAPAIRSAIAACLLVILSVPFVSAQNNASDSVTKPEKKRIWPFSFGGSGRKKEEPTDPFVNYGDQQQRQLASNLTGTPISERSNYEPPKTDRTLPKGSPYPWPAPVDSHNRIPTSRDVLAGTAQPNASNRSITEQLRTSRVNLETQRTRSVAARPPATSDKMTAIPAINYPRATTTQPNTPTQPNTLASPAVRYPVPSPSQHRYPHQPQTAQRIQQASGNTEISPGAFDATIAPIQSEFMPENAPSPTANRNTTWSSRTNGYHRNPKSQLGTTRHSQAGAGYESAVRRITNSRQNPFFDPKSLPDYDYQNIQSGRQSQSSRRGWKDGVLVDPPATNQVVEPLSTEPEFDFGSKSSDDLGSSGMVITPPTPEINVVDVPTPHRPAAQVHSVDVPTPTRPTAQLSRSLDVPVWNEQPMANAIDLPNATPPAPRIESSTPTYGNGDAGMSSVDTPREPITPTPPQAGGNIYDSQPRVNVPQSQMNVPQPQVNVPQPQVSMQPQTSPQRPKPIIDHNAYDTREIEQDIWGGPRMARSNTPKPSNPTPRNIPYLDGPGATQRQPQSTRQNTPPQRSQITKQPPLHVPDIKSPQLEIPSNTPPPVEVPQINLPSIDPPVVKRQPPSTNPDRLPGMPAPNQPERQPQAPLALTNPKYGGARVNTGRSIYEQQGAVASLPASPTSPAYPSINDHPSLSAPPRVATPGPAVAENSRSQTSTAPSNYPVSQVAPSTRNTVSTAESGLALETRPIQQLSPAALSRLGSLDETTVVLAVVGDQSILAGDLLWQINQQLAPHIGVAPEEELAKARVMGMQRLLPKVIENKLVFMDFLRTIPREKFPEIEGKIYKEFNRTKLPTLLKESKLESPAELDAELRKIGSSLAKQQRLFLEQLVGQQMVQQNVRMNREITHDEMLKYYYDHSSDYEHPANVKWERIMVRWSEYPTKQAALTTLINAGDRVLLKGESFSAVAKQVSQGPNAALGGLFESTTKGSLRSEKIERAIFALPVGKMAKIVEDTEGAHIIRVIDRTPAGRTAFEEVQSEIKLAIRKSRFEEQVKDYLAKLKKETMVQTIFDQPASQVATPGSGTLLR